MTVELKWIKSESHSFGFSLLLVCLYSLSLSLSLSISYKYLDIIHHNCWLIVCSVDELFGVMTRVRGRSHSGRDFNMSPVKISPTYQLLLTRRWDAQPCWHSLPQKPPLSSLQPIRSHLSILVGRNWRGTDYSALVWAVRRCLTGQFHLYGLVILQTII